MKSKEFVESANNQIKRTSSNGLHITVEAKPRTCSPNMEDMRISNPEVAEIVSNIFGRYIRDNERPVIIKETEEIFPSVSAAGKAYGASLQAANTTVTASCEKNKPVSRGVFKGKTFSWAADKTATEMKAFEKAMKDAGFKNYVDFMDSKAQKRTQMELHKAQFLEDMLSGNYTLTTREKIELKKALGL